MELTSTRNDSEIHFISYPRMEPPPIYILKVVDVFKKYENEIGTVIREKGLTSNDVLNVLSEDLLAQKWDIEVGKHKDQIIERPVFFGEDGIPTLMYKIDGYHKEWRCGLEIEAGRAWMGNAVYRDLIQALVMVHVDHLILAVPNKYKYRSSGKETISNDYSNTCSVADTLYGHTRIKLPYGLTVIGY
jgi:hypothetical protein